MNVQTRRALPQGPILGIETSCDETAAAILGADGSVLANVVASQHAVHERFGGVVPELASRAHIEMIERVVLAAVGEGHVAWDSLVGIAVTQGPGLAGALIVGLNYAKSLAYMLGLPLVGVSHLEAHIASAWLEDPKFPPSCIVLVVSGGHTHLYRRDAEEISHLLGCTRDDAAGEAFDKGAQMLGLGFPGGPALDRLAQTGKSVSFARKAPIIFGLLLSVSIVGANYTNDTAMIIFFLALAFFGAGMALISWVFVSILSPKHLIGLTGGVFNFMGNLASIVVPIAIGYLAKDGDFRPALAFIGILGFIGACSYIFIVGKIERVK